MPSQPAPNVPVLPQLLVGSSDVTATTGDEFSISELYTMVQALAGHLRQYLVCWLLSRYMPDVESS